MQCCADDIAAMLPDTCTADSRFWTYDIETLVCATSAADFIMVSMMN